MFKILPLQMNEYESSISIKVKIGSAFCNLSFAQRNVAVDNKEPRSDIGYCNIQNTEPDREKIKRIRNKNQTTASYPQGSWLNNLEFKLSKDDSTKVSAFLAHWLLIRRFLKWFSTYFNVKFWFPILAPSLPGGHDLNNLESSLPQDAST